MKFNSIKFKISVLYIVVLGIILIVYSGFLYFSLHYTLYDELDKELDKKAQEIARAIDSYADVFGRSPQEFNSAVKRVITFAEGYPGDEGISGLEQQWLQKVDKFDLKEDYINLSDIKGKPIATSANLQGMLYSLSLKEKRKLQGGNPVFKSIRFEKRNLRLISVPFSYSDSEQYIIQVGTSLKPVIHLLQARLMHIAISIPVFLLFFSFAGRLFVSRILRPVVEITKAASNITHKDLSLRVRAEHVDEEMRYLVDAFNDMISRLEQSFKYIAEFSAHVAHDLKTPLAIIRGESDIALRKDRNIQEYKRVIRGNLEETERMLKVIEDLLLLTRLDYRSQVLKFEPFDLIEFLREICEQSKILVAAKNIVLNIDMPDAKIYINADRLHLRRLFFNLLDNAIKFSSENGEIGVKAESQGNKIEVSISDRGAGIRGEDLPRIFDRFFHKDVAEDSGGSGTGLGLTIARSIAKINRGDIRAKSTLGKDSVFTVILPLA